jgi:hypothetical protein
LTTPPGQSFLYCQQIHTYKYDQWWGSKQNSWTRFRKTFL